MASLTARGVPVFPSDMPGLFVGPTIPELTYRQLLDLACRHDPSFDPARVLRSNSPEAPLGT